MAGPLALVGAGAFLPGMAEIDRDLLSWAGGRRPRVAILPTAAHPDGPAIFERQAALGVAHFRRLGAEVEPVLVRDVGDAADPAALQAIGEADLIYLSGGWPAHLRSVLVASPLGAALRGANRRGAIVAGCAAGAMVLAQHVAGPRSGRGWLPWPLRWDRGLGLVAGAAVLPAYDRWPEPIAALIALQAPRDSTVLGIDAATALVGQDGSWQVLGPARVTVWQGRQRTRYRAGDKFRFSGPGGP